MSFLTAASRKVDDVRGFLRDAAGSSIKYVAEKGARHQIYIPYVEKEVVKEGVKSIVKEIIAISGNVHEWTDVSGRYQSTVCMDGIVRKDENTGELLNDGSCPFCKRVQDGWEIFKYRKELEEARCQLTGEERKKHMEKVTSTMNDERKAKEARAYMYMLVVKFRLSDAGEPVLGTDGLPEYELKIMKLSSSRVEKINQQLLNAGIEMADAEIIFEYPNTDDAKVRVGQSTTSPVFPDRRLTTRFPALRDKIRTDIAKFTWDGIEKSFPEWKGMTSMEAEKVMTSMFEKWDQYQLELKVNPGAQYMEYIGAAQPNNPAIGQNNMGATPTMGQAGQAIPAGPAGPAPVFTQGQSIFGGQPIGGQQTTTPTEPKQAQPTQASQAMNQPAGQAGPSVPDVSAIFGGNAGIPRDI